MDTLHFPTNTQTWKALTTFLPKFRSLTQAFHPLVGCPLFETWKESMKNGLEHIAAPGADAKTLLMHYSTLDGFKNIKIKGHELEIVIGLPGQNDKIKLCTPNRGSATLSLIDFQKPSLSAILTVCFFNIQKIWFLYIQP